MRKLLAVLALVCCTQAQTKAPVVHALSRAASVQPANLTSTAVLLASGAIADAFAVRGDGVNGATGTIQPGAGLWQDGKTSDERQINVPPFGNFTTATSNAVHDAPSIVLTSSGSILELYGAASTYIGYHPPANWRCFGTAYCQPFKIAPARDGDRIVEHLSNSPEYLLPSIGLSEISSASVGNATIIGGQQQPSSADGQPGAQGYVTLQGDDTFDTASGPWHFRSSHAPAADGLSTPLLTPSDNAYADFTVSSSGGPATMNVDLDGTSCSLRLDSGASPAEAARNAAVSYDAQCQTLRRRVELVPVAFDPVLHADGMLGFLSVGDSAALPNVSALRLTCGGALTCGVPHDERASGLHRHYLYGGLVTLGGHAYYLMDVEQVTGSWYGSEHNSLGLALVCLRTDRQEGAAWVWTDCAGGHPFTVRPGERGRALLDRDSPYYVHPPQGGYPSAMLPYLYDMSMRAQPPAASSKYYPVVSQMSAALLPDHDLVIAHGCQTNAGVLTVCYAQLDGHVDRTLRAGFVAMPNGSGSLASLAMRSDGSTVRVGVLAGIGDRWGCLGHAPCLLQYRFDAANGTWQRIAAQTVGTTAEAGFPGSVVPTARGFLVTLKTPDGGDNAKLDVFEIR